MSKTRNQRRRDRNIDRIVCWVLALMLVFLIGLLIKQVGEIEALQAAQNAKGTVTVVRAEDFLPAGFDPNCPEYQAALQRYDEENGLVFGQKEAAPEWANSEAVDATRKDS